MQRFSSSFYFGGWLTGAVHNCHTLILKERTPEHHTTLEDPEIPEASG
jgi:hypothetical protein